MGNKQVIFSEEQLEAYQDCTFFTRKEILRIFRRFQELSPELNITRNTLPKLKMPRQRIENMAEFKENPFRQRICEVFSEDGHGDMTFDDFLDMFSVFSEAAPRDIKVVYAFKIYGVSISKRKRRTERMKKWELGFVFTARGATDFDRDNQLGKQDMVNTIRHLTRCEMTLDEVQFIVSKIFEEADLNDDGKLSYTEYEHVIAKSPDFGSVFHIRI